MLDISCFYGTDAFADIQVKALEIFAAHDTVTIDEVIKGLDGSCFVLGQHYFLTNPFTGSGVSPVFDFRDGFFAGDSSAFIVTNKTGDIPAPTGSQDVDWLELVSVEGTVAKTVLRLDTHFGQPPSSVSKE